MSGAVQAPVTQELAPCPFCGWDAALGNTRYHNPLPDTRWDDGSPVIETHSVNCVRCGGSVGNVGGVGGYQTREQATTAWNIRTAAEAASAARVAELVEALGVAVAAADVFLDGGDMHAIEAFEDWLPKARAILARAKAIPDAGEG